MKHRNTIKLAAGMATLLIMSTSLQAGYTLKKKIGDVDTKLTIFGFSQLEMRGGKGSKIGDDSSVSFHAQRIRLGWKYVAGKVRSKVFIDFNKNSAANNSGNTGGGASGIGVPDTIKDAFVAYDFNKALIPKMGVLKMPHGMSFTMPGWNLDIAERGLDKALVLERNMGLMISGRDIGFGDHGKVTGLEMGHERAWKGFGYDVMIANQSGRSTAVTGAGEGKGNSYAVRGMFDWTEALHLEASYGLSEDADGVNSPADVDYKTYDLGIDSNLGQLGLKAEYIAGFNTKGRKDYDENALSLTAQYAITDTFEPSIKFIQGNAQDPTNGKTELSNTYLGLNIFLAQFNHKFDRNSKRNRNAHKLVFNYIVASGDTDGSYKGLKGVKDNEWIVQWQVKF